MVAGAATDKLKMRADGTRTGDGRRQRIPISFDLRLVADRRKKGIGGIALEGEPRTVLRLELRKALVAGRLKSRLVGHINAKGLKGPS